LFGKDKHGFQPPISNHQISILSPQFAPRIVTETLRRMHT
jgi:hypothetical protein